MIPFSCPLCHESVELSDDWDYAVIACPHCGRTTNLMAANDAAELQAEDRLGHFVLITLLGSGGNGTVWKAHDRELDRDVAIKFPSRDVIEQKDRVRFLREASLAARVKHPHIVPIHHVGESELQRPLPDGTFEKLPSRLHIISELVDGAGLDRFIKAGQRPTPANAARIVERIADALGAAHEAAVIHRDVKPSNIMLDREGSPFLLDFGVSKSSDTENRTISLEGAVIGSPGYLSPEQARGENTSLDVRSDVYSLGVVLFELLTFRLPFEGTEKEIEHAAADATRDAPSPRQFVPDLPRDLETICLKCLEKDRALRFANGRELAEELRRFQEGFPILSRPITRAERFVRWCKRKPLIAGLAAAVLLTLSIGSWVALSLDRSRSEFKKQVVLKKEELEAKDSELKVKDDEIKTKGEQKAWQDYVADMQEIERVWPANDVETVKQLLAKHEPQPEDGRRDLRGFEWYYWNRLLNAAVLNVRAPGRVVSVAWTPDDEFLWTTDVTGRLLRWDVVNGKSEEVLGPDTQSLIMAADEQGQRLAVIVKQGREIQLLEARAGKPLGLIKAFQFPFTAVAFTPDGKLLVTADMVGQVIAWNMPSGREKINLVRNKTSRRNPLNVMQILDVHEGPVLGLAVSPDGRFVSSAGVDGTSRTWELATGAFQRSVERSSPAELTSVAFNRAGTLLVGRGKLREEDRLRSKPEYPGEIAVWKHPGNERLFHFTFPSETTSQWIEGPPSGTLVLGGNLAEFAQSDRLLVGATGELVRLWKTSFGREVDVLRGHQAPVVALRVAHNDRLVASADESGTVKVWNLNRSAGDQSVATLPDLADGLAYSAAENQVAVLSDAGWSFTAGGRSQRSEEKRVVFQALGETTLPKPSRQKGRILFAIASSPSGKFLAEHRNRDRRAEAEVVITDFKTQDVLWSSPLPQRKKTSCMAWRTDRELFVIQDSSLYLVEHDRPPQLIQDVDTAGVQSITFNRAGDQMALGRVSGAIDLYDAQHWTKLATLQGQTQPILSLSYSKDDRRLASACGRVFQVAGAQAASVAGSIVIWDMRTQERCLTLHPANGRQLAGLAFSDDGNRLYAVENGLNPPECELRCWNTDTPRLTASDLRAVASEKGSRPVAEPLAVVPPATRPPQVPLDPRVREFELRPANPFAMNVGPVVGFSSLTVHPQGDLLAAVDVNGLVTVWSLSTQKILRSKQMTGRLASWKIRFTGNGRHLVCMHESAGITSILAAENLSELYFEETAGRSLFQVAVGDDVRQPWKLDTRDSLRRGDEMITLNLPSGHRGLNAVSPDEQFIAMVCSRSAGDSGASRSHELILVSLAKKTVLWMAALDSPASLIGFSKDGATVYAVVRDATSGASVLQQFSAAEGTPMPSVKGLRDPIAISGDLRKVLELENAEVFVRDVATQQRSQKPVAKRVQLRSAIWLPDGTHFGSIGGQNVVEIGSTEPPPN